VRRLVGPSPGSLGRSGAESATDLTDAAKKVVAAAKGK